MKKKKKKGKRTLTAVGAVVAAGLTPGFIAVSATGATLPSPNAEVTAAEVVCIDGDTFSFDELYAMQQVDRNQRHNAAQRPQSSSQQATRYGVPRPQAPKYAAPRPQYPPSTLYGVPRPRIPVVVEQSSTVDREDIQTGILKYLIGYCNLLIDADKRGIIISQDSDLTRDLGMNEDDLKDLKAEIEDRYGVAVSHHRFRLIGQLNTLYLVSEYITKLKTVRD
jgi:hypothetical protein